MLSFLRFSSLESPGGSEFNRLSDMSSSVRFSNLESSGGSGISCFGVKGQEDDRPAEILRRLVEGQKGCVDEPRQGREGAEIDGLFEAQARGLEIGQDFGPDVERQGRPPFVAGAQGLDAGSVDREIIVGLGHPQC